MPQNRKDQKQELTTALQRFKSNKVQSNQLLLDISNYDYSFFKNVLKLPVSLLSKIQKQLRNRNKSNLNLKLNPKESNLLNNKIYTFLTSSTNKTLGINSNQLFTNDYPLAIKTLILYLQREIFLNKNSKKSMDLARSVYQQIVKKQYKQALKVISNSHLEGPIKRNILMILITHLQKIKSEKQVSIEDNKQNAKNQNTYVNKELGKLISKMDQCGGIEIQAKILQSPHLINCTGVHLNILTNTALFIIDDPYKQQKTFDLKQQGINLEDLAVCLKIVYRLKIGNISFSLDPYEPNNPKGPWQKKVFSPKLLEGTKFGEKMFAADYLMKQQSLGIKVDSIKPVLKTSSYVYPKELQNAGLKPGYKMRDKQFKLGKHNWNRKWIVVKEKIKSFQRNNRYTNSILFNDIKMGIDAREMYSTKQGHLKDKSMQDQNHYAYKWAAKFTDLYDIACKYYPEYEVLKSMSKAMALAKWMYTKQVKIDMNLINTIFQNQKLRKWDQKVPALNQKTNVKTWEEKEIIQVDKRRYSIEMLKKQGIVTTEEMIQKSIKYINKNKLDVNFTKITTYSSQQYVFGGVSLAPDFDNLFDDLEIKSDNETMTTMSTQNAKKIGKQNISQSKKQRKQKNYYEEEKYDLKYEQMQKKKPFKKISEQEKKAFIKVEILKLKKKIKKKKLVTIPFLQNNNCQICNTKIGFKMHHFSKNGKFYCELHHPHNCTNCMKHIVGQSVTVQKKLYHPNCLLCAECLKPITGQICTIENEIIHSKCGDKFQKRLQREDEGDMSTDVSFSLDF